MAPDAIPFAARPAPTMTGDVLRVDGGTRPWAGALTP
jgi:hypothetical protein